MKPWRYDLVAALEEAAGGEMAVGNRVRETAALQAVVGVLAAIPVLAGVAGVAIGPALLGVGRPWPTDLDSHFRFLSGVFIVVGLAWYSCIPHIELKAGRFRLLAAMTFCGGLARLLSLALVGWPSAGHVAGLCIELVAVPLLVLWQARIADR